MYLPFMTILLLARIGEKELKGADRRRRYRRESTLLGDFLRINAYLPIFALIYLVAAPIVSRYVLHQDLYQERGRIESIVKNKLRKVILFIFGTIRLICISLASVYQPVIC